MDKLEIIEGKGVFVNDKKIDGVTDWSIKPDPASSASGIRLKKHFRDLRTASFRGSMNLASILRISPKC